MSTAALSGLFAILGVLVGGFASHILSLRREREARRHQLDAARQDLLRSRREELYALVAKWSLLISTNNLTFSSVMQGKLDYNDANDLLIKNAKDSPLDFNRIELLIEAFCPACREAYAKCLGARTLMNQVFTEFKREYDTRGPYQPYNQLKAYITAGTTFEAASDTLKAVIVREVRVLSS